MSDGTLYCQTCKNPLHLCGSHTGNGCEGAPQPEFLTASGRHDHGAETAAAHGLARSPHWHAVEKAHLAKEPECVCCKPGESPKGLQVHHQFPFHFAILLGRPDLELDDRNLITLCETEKNEPGPNHHLLVGHLDNFQSSNLKVAVDAHHTFHGWTAERIKASTLWQAEVAHRLKPWNEMSDSDKQDLRRLMDKMFPKP